MKVFIEKEEFKIDTFIRGINIRWQKECEIEETQEINPIRSLEPRENRENIGANTQAKALSLTLNNKISLFNYTSRVLVLQKLIDIIEICRSRLFFPNEIKFKDEPSIQLLQIRIPALESTGELLYY